MKTTPETAPETGAQALEATRPLKTFTVFCRDVSDRGTTWISQVTAEDVEGAKAAAIAECADDWQYDTEYVACIGIAEGIINILHWEDLSK